jgi:thymidylate synthase
MVVNAWHPANAAVSKLPPCHYTFALTVQNGKINLHLTQRSGDIAVGVPFNIAAYSLVAHMIANQTDFSVGKFGHTIIDAHVYCGEGDRGEWYGRNINELQTRINRVEKRDEFNDVRQWLENKAPKQQTEGYDHIPKLLTQLSREPLERPSVTISDKPIDRLSSDDIHLSGYDSYPGLSFGVAE